jgi:hypothetical protein
MKKFIFVCVFIVLAAMVIGNFRIGDIFSKPNNLDNTSEDVNNENNLESLQLYSAPEIREMFEMSPKLSCVIYDNKLIIEYPDFMKKEEDSWGSQSMRVSFYEVVMTAKVFEDDYDMSVREKYDALNMTAVTKSVSDSSFMMAGRSVDNMRYFEKFMLVDYRTWLYLRVDFPKELTWAVDPILHYVKDYKPDFVWKKNNSK